MRFDRPIVFLHSDAFVPGCDCGDREWEVQLPMGWMWTEHAPPGYPFESLEAAMDCAQSLRPDDPMVTRSAPVVPDRWFLSPTLDMTTPIPSWLRADPAPDPETPEATTPT